MSRKAIIRVYEENRFTGEKDLKYSDEIVTELTVAEIIDFLQVNDGFGACMVEGNVLSFLDFSCIAVPVDKVLSRIKNLPVAKEEPRINLPDRCMLSVTEEHNEEPLTRSEQELVYICDRFECGASGFSELVISVITHPFSMIFIGGWLWDKTKELYYRFKGWFGYHNGQVEECSPIMFSPKKFHKDLAQMINLSSKEFQIIKIGRVKRGEHKVIVRTIKNETYEVSVNTRGKIISLKQKP